jgi:hypothetical protein
MLGCIDGALDLVGIAVTALTLQHICNRSDLCLTMLYFPMACKALDLMFLSMGFMQFYTVRRMFHCPGCPPVSNENLFGVCVIVAVQTYPVIYFAHFLYFFFVAGIFTACFVRNKLRMVNRNQTSLNNLIRDFMAACTTCFDKLLAGLRITEEMTREAYLFVNAEMFIALKVAVTNTASDIDSIDNLLHMVLVSKLDAIKVDILC